MTDQERRMTHQQVLKLGEALGREVMHHRELARSTENPDDIIVRVLVTGYVDALEALWGDRDPRVVAGRLRAHVNGQVEAQLTRLFPGQDIGPVIEPQVTAGPTLQGVVDDWIDEYTGENGDWEAAAEALDMTEVEYLTFIFEEGNLADGMLEDLIAEALGAKTGG